MEFEELATHAQRWFATPATLASFDFHSVRGMTGGPILRRRNRPWLCTAVVAELRSARSASLPWTSANRARARGRFGATSFQYWNEVAPGRRDWWQGPQALDRQVHVRSDPFGRPRLTLLGPNYHRTA